MKLRIVLVLSLLVCGFCFGTAYSQNRLCPLLTEQNETAWSCYSDLNTAKQELWVLRNKPPEIKVVRVPVEVRVEILRERPVEVVKEVPVEVIREVPIYLTDWADVEELEAFLEEDDTDSHFIARADKDGRVLLNKQCEDRALQLRDRAMAKGKHLEVTVLSPDEYYKWYRERIEPNRGHAICMAKVGDNEFWYIEPSNDSHWLAVYLD